MSEWLEYKISDVADVIGGGTPKTAIDEYWNGDIPWLSVVDFNTGKKYVSSTEKSITSLGLEKSSTKLLAQNDIIISARGTVGALAMLDKPMTFNQSCYGMRAKENTTSDYLFYLLKNTVRHLQQASYGAVFDTITRNTFDETYISLPALEEQKAIAEVLSSLDDKIDLLHRQNKTLEELAQTLFRQWFIEEAKDKWEENIGNTLIQIIDGDRGKNYPKSTEFFPDEYCLFLNAKNVTNNGFNFSTCNFITREKDELLRSGKLERNDIVLTTRGTVGNLALYDELIAYDNVRINSGMVIFRSYDISPIYLYILMKSQYFTDSVVEQTSGSAQPQLPIRDIKNIKIILPPKDSLEDFLSKATPLYKKINQNKQQIRTLEKMRDTLLPKLMSGDVRVKI